MPKHLSSKNISYHPEAEKIIGIKGSREVIDRAQRILKESNLPIITADSLSEAADKVVGALKPRAGRSAAGNGQS